MTTPQLRLSEQEVLEMVKSVITGRGLSLPKDYYLHRSPEGKWTITTTIPMRAEMDEVTGRMLVK